MAFLGMKKLEQSTKLGFTIIELLVVIVVMGILVVIIAGSYTEVKQRVIVASLQSDLTNAFRRLKIDQVSNNIYPITLEQANDGRGVSASPGTTYQYNVDNNSVPQIFCVSATKESISYHITQDSMPAVGICPIFNFDAGNPISYSGSGTKLTDLSGKGNNGTLKNGVEYSSVDDGVLSLDGEDDYIVVTTLDAYSVGMWVKPSSSQSVAHPTYYNQSSISSSQGYWWVFSEGTSSNINWQYSDGSSQKTIAWNDAITYNAWNYFVFIFSESDKTITLYKNGDSIGTRDCPNALLPSSDLFIGDYQGQSSGYNLKGLVNSFRVYDEVLNADEISKIFETHRRRYEL